MTRQVVDDLSLLVEISQLFTVSDLNTVLHKVVDLAARAVGATTANLFMFKDGEVDWHYIIDDENFTPDVVQEILGHGLAGWVARHREIAVIENTLIDKRWAKIRNEEIKDKSAVGLPLIYQNELMAVVTLAHTSPEYFSERDVQLLTIISNQAALAIHNVRLFERLRSKHNQLQVMMRAVADILLVVDETGIILFASDSACGLLGTCQEKDHIGQNLLTMPLPDDGLFPIQNYIREPQPIGVDLEVRSDHLEKEFSVAVRPWNDSQDTSGHVIIFHDVTMLKDLSRFKDEMLRLASHDLRSPLGLIVGYADLIKMDTPEPDSPVHQHIDVIFKATNRMGTLLEDLLRVEQIRKSPLELQEQIDPVKMVKVVLVNMRHSAEAKNIALSAEYQIRADISVMADPVLIRQAMENLVGNAIKYTPAGGQVMIHANADSESFEFIVEDTGIGIPEEDIPNIFEAFYRVQKPEENNENEDGAGLGLNLVKNVVERHGGSVLVESEVEVGSRIGFRLPINQD